MTEELRQRIRREVAAAPPLAPDDAERIRALLPLAGPARRRPRIPVRRPAAAA